MVIVNPPDHTRYRNWWPKASLHVRPTRSNQVAEVTAALIDELAGRPNPDLIADFAMRLPVAIIAEILDLPAGSHDRMLEWGIAAPRCWTSGSDGRPIGRPIDGLRDTDGYFHEHIDQMRDGGTSENPFSRMAADGTLTDRELAANAALIVGAGFETTVNLIGNGIALGSDIPSSSPYCATTQPFGPAPSRRSCDSTGPVQMTSRTASCDVEIAGYRIARGSMSGCCSGEPTATPWCLRTPTAWTSPGPMRAEHLGRLRPVFTPVWWCRALARIEGVTALRSLFEAFPEPAPHRTPRAGEGWSTCADRRAPRATGARQTASLHLGDLCTRSRGDRNCACTNHSVGVGKKKSSCGTPGCEMEP